MEFTYKSHDLDMKIADNGAGMQDVVRISGKEGLWGLLGMRERAQRIRATLSITSQTGFGTIIDVRIPARFAYISNRRSSLSRFFQRDGHWLDSENGFLRLFGKSRRNKGKDGTPE